MNRLVVVPLAAFLSLLGAHQAVAGLASAAFPIPEPGTSAQASATEGAGVWSGVPMDLPKQLAPELISIRDAGEAVPADTRERLEARLDAVRRRVDEEAATNGEERIITRIAAELGMSEDELLNERNELTVGWGNLLVAHTIAANAGTRVSVAQLFDLFHEGVQWAQIAAGLELDFNELVWAVGVETRVALGFGKPDGQIAAVPIVPSDTGLSADVHPGR